jgi:hypothetical protein
VSSGRPVLAAAVSGFAAFMIGRILEDALPGRLVGLQRLVESGRLHPDAIAEVTAQWAAIREAGRQWADHRTAVDGTTAEAVTAIPPRSTEIDSGAAAGLLGVSPNRIRQLARNGDIPGRKVARTWLVDRTAIDLRRECEHGPVR